MNKIETTVSLATLHALKHERDVMILAPKELKTQAYGAFVKENNSKQRIYTVDGIFLISLVIDDELNNDTPQCDTVFIINPQDMADEALAMAKEKSDMLVCVKV